MGDNIEWNAKFLIVEIYSKMSGKNEDSARCFCEDM